MISKTDTHTVAVTPGIPATIGLSVANLRDRIDGIAPRVTGIDPSYVTLPVPFVSVFPDSTETIRVVVDLPKWFACGPHDIEIELRSTIDGESTVVHPVTLEVQPIDELELQLLPRASTGGSRTEFVAEVRNLGNIVVDLVVDGADAERTLDVEADPVFIRVPNGDSVMSTVKVRGRRPFYGAPVIRTISVTAENSAQRLTDTFRFTQKARIPSGVGTILTLAAIVALWAFVFIWAIGQVFAGESAAKTAGEGFAAGGPATIDVAGISGSVVGTVVSPDGVGVPRVTVLAFRAGTDDAPAASVATDEAGAFEIPVLPGSYSLRIGDRTDVAVEEVNVKPSLDTDPITLSFVGRPGGVQGRVVTGADVAPPIRVVVRPLVDDVAGEPLTDIGIEISADGTYAVTGLATPATYQLTVSAAGFDPQTIVADVPDGGDVIVNTSRLGAGAGSIRGTVVSRNLPIGAVTVALSAGDFTMETTTPTTGADLGTFVFDGLETPRTYLLTFSAEGFTAESVALELEAGSDFPVIDEDNTEPFVVELFRGTGEVSGTARQAGGGLLGAVDVTINGAGINATVQTLTDGEAGTYRFADLPTPGNYVLTFSREGFESATIAVALGDRSSRTGADATLRPDSGSITGTATFGSVLSAGITVTLSDGATLRTTETVTAPAGSYRFTGLPPGSYTVTFEAAGAAYTVLVPNLEPGQTATADADFAPTPSP
jgi:Carboxypeptidase regulatory-like domain